MVGFQVRWQMVGEPFLKPESISLHSCYWRNLLCVRQVLSTGFDYFLACLKFKNLSKLEWGSRTLWVLEFQTRDGQPPLTSGGPSSPPLLQGEGVGQKKQEKLQAWPQDFPGSSALPRTPLDMWMADAYACVLSHFSRVWLFVTLWTRVSEAPPPMGFSRQEFWNGFPCPPPEDLPYPGIEPASLMSTCIGRQVLYH